MYRKGTIRHPRLSLAPPTFVDPPSNPYPLSLLTVHSIVKKVSDGKQKDKLDSVVQDLGEQPCGFDTILLLMCNQRCSYLYFWILLQTIAQSIGSDSFLFCISKFSPIFSNAASSPPLFLWSGVGCLNESSLRLCILCIFFS